MKSKHTKFGWNKYGWKGLIINVEDIFTRTRILLGSSATEKLSAAHVAVFGIGGVGSFTVEALARAGIGEITLVDKDRVCVSNINRQLIALHSTVDKPKVEVMKERILDINPQTKVHMHQCFYLPDTANEFDFSRYTYIIDAVDTVTAKLELAVQAKAAGIPLISCMGAGNKLDPTRFEVADIYQTSVCPLAKVMRRELRACGIEKLKVLYSKEPPIVTQMPEENNSENGKKVPGSISFVPSVAGLIIGGEVIKDIVK